MIDNNIFKAEEARQWSRLEEMMLSPGDEGGPGSGGGGRSGPRGGDLGRGALLDMLRRNRRAVDVIRRGDPRGDHPMFEVRMKNTA